MAKVYSDDYDKGYTKLFGHGFISKASVLVETYGTIDELNSMIGLARSQTKDSEIDDILHKIQRDLFVVGTDLASPEVSEGEKPVSIREVDVKNMESIMERLEKELPQLKNFILPAGNPAASALQVARALCRRAERRAVSLKGEKGVNQEVLRYLNRLSDLLFYLARAVNHREGGKEEIWRKPGTTL